VASDKGRRIEARFPDPMANPYLCFAALMMAGLDGIENKIHPGEAATKDLYHLPPEEDALVPTVCHSLDQALEHLDKGRAFLTKGGVFTDSMIDAYIDLKMQESGPVFRQGRASCRIRHVLLTLSPGIRAVAKRSRWAHRGRPGAVPFF
jgi:glutamine synthetase